MGQKFFIPAQTLIAVKLLKRILQRFFRADFCCVSASHHFSLFFLKTGSLEGFVVLELPRYFLQHARKLGC